jgi:O-antigen/teichoic acid export membrane protein
VQNLADRRILNAFVPLSEVGLYGVGYTFGSAVKFALSAFEPAWQPFVYAQLGKPDGRQTLARLATYVLAAFTFVALGLNVIFGYAGQHAFGHPVFFGVGAYASALLALETKWRSPSSPEPPSRHSSRQPSAIRAFGSAASTSAWRRLRSPG